MKGLEHQILEFLEALGKKGVINKWLSRMEDMKIKFQDQNSPKMKVKELMIILWLLLIKKTNKRSLTLKKLILVDVCTPIEKYIFKL